MTTLVQQNILKCILTSQRNKHNLSIKFNWDFTNTDVDTRFLGLYVMCIQKTPISILAL